MYPLLTPNFYTYTDSPTVITYGNPKCDNVGATVVIPSSTPFQLPYNLDLNKNDEVRKQVTKYIRHKLLYKWLYSDMPEILGFFKYDETSGVHLINDMSEFDKNAKYNDTIDVIDKKVEYIKNYILTHEVAYKMLKHFIKKTNANWYDLHKDEYFVKEALRHKFEKMLRDLVNIKRTV
jgi:hypothetical protein